MKFNLENFSGTIKKLRKEKGATQADVAKFLGCFYQNYQSLEYGKTTPSASTLFQLAEYFNVSTDYLLGRTDQPAPYPPARRK